MIEAEMSKDTRAMQADAGLHVVFAAVQARADQGLTLSTRTELAKALGVSKQAVAQWSRVPVEHVLDIEKLLGIPRQVLRPDVYPLSETAGTQGLSAQELERLIKEMRRGSED